jgi:hypothetical protein
VAVINLQPEQTAMSTENEPRPTITEEIEIAGAQLVDQIKKLIAEGNVRQLRIKDADGDVFLETPLTFGALAGGAVVLAAPWLAMLGVLAALVTRVRIEIVREAKADEPEPARPAARETLLDDAPKGRDAA